MKGGPKRGWRQGYFRDNSTRLCFTATKWLYSRKTKRHKISEWKDWTIHDRYMCPLLMWKVRERHQKRQKRVSSGNCFTAAAALQLQVFVVVIQTWHCCKVLYAITKTIISISLAAVFGSKLCKLRQQHSHAVQQSESTYIFFFFFFFFLVFTLPTSIQILAFFNSKLWALLVLSPDCNCSSRSIPVLSFLTSDSGKNSSSCFVCCCYCKKKNEEEWGRNTLCKY